MLCHLRCQEPLFLGTFCAIFGLVQGPLPWVLTLPTLLVPHTEPGPLRLIVGLSSRPFGGRVLAPSSRPPIKPVACQRSSALIVLFWLRSCCPGNCSSHKGIRILPEFKLSASHFLKQRSDMFFKTILERCGPSSIDSITGFSSMLETCVGKTGADGNDRLASFAHINVKDRACPGPESQDFKHLWGGSVRALHSCTPTF